jgi:hypothetical protein
LPPFETRIDPPDLGIHLSADAASQFEVTSATFATWANRRACPTGSDAVMTSLNSGHAPFTCASRDSSPRTRDQACDEMCNTTSRHQTTCDHQRKGQTMTSTTCHSNTNSDVTRTGVQRSLGVTCPGRPHPLLSTRILVTFVCLFVSLISFASSSSVPKPFDPLFTKDQIIAIDNTANSSSSSSSSSSNHHQKNSNDINDDDKVDLVQSTEGHKVVKRQVGQTGK